MLVLLFFFTKIKRVVKKAEKEKENKEENSAKSVRLQYISQDTVRLTLCHGD